MVDDDLQRFIEAGARLFGLTLQPEWHDSIRLHLAISLQHAQAVSEFPLPDETDPAPIFSA